MPDRVLPAAPALAAHIAALEAAITAQRGWGAGAALVCAALDAIAPPQTSTPTIERRSGAGPAAA